MSEAAVPGSDFSSPVEASTHLDPRSVQTSTNVDPALAKIACDKAGATAIIRTAKAAIQVIRVRAIRKCIR